MKQLFIPMVLGLWVALQPANADMPATRLNYNVHRISGSDGKSKAGPPVIDGVVSHGEWENAATPAANFTLLREWPRPDNQNSRFRMLWDNQALYILIEINYGGWKPATDFPDLPPFDGSHDSPTLYFRPQPSVVPPPDSWWLADGYQIAWHIDQGFAMRNPVRSGDYKMGLYFEGHSGFLFGDQANWYVNLNEGCDFSNYADCVLPGLQIAQNAGPKGCVVEVRIAWEAFNAPGPGGDAGAPLYHPFAPNAGEQWAFECGQTTTDPNNLFPSWSDRKAQAFGVLTQDPAWPIDLKGRAFFAQWPHGTITFKGAAEEK